VVAVPELPLPVVVEHGRRRPAGAEGVAGTDARAFVLVTRSPGTGPDRLLPRGSNLLPPVLPSATVRQMTSADIAHSIDELRQSMGGWSWSNFTSSIVGTLVGALLAGGVAIWVLQKQRRDRYEERIADAVQRTVEALVAYEELRRVPHLQSPEVDSAAQHASAAMLVLDGLCDTTDREVVQACRALLGDIRRVHLAQPVAQALTQLIGFVVRLLRRDRLAAVQIALIKKEHERLSASGLLPQNSTVRP
jgi:hypothetical protein